MPKPGCLNDLWTHLRIVEGCEVAQIDRSYDRTTIYRNPPVWVVHGVGFGTSAVVGRVRRPSLPRAM